jgi:hypothetical protein
LESCHSVIFKSSNPKVKSIEFDQSKSNKSGSYLDSEIFVLESKNDEGSLAMTFCFYQQSFFYDLPINLKISHLPDEHGYFSGFHPDEDYFSILYHPLESTSIDSIK